MPLTHPLFLSGEDLRAFRSRLLRHFRSRGRTLPWRDGSDPYATLVSEFMLQQTRVETVVPYFERWMERFPTLEALAEAPEEAVLKEWKGLGYYSRARNLHQAARMVRDRYHGTIPEVGEELRSLPGVGPYTAGAIASIAYQRPVPAVDGNVRRVLARLLDVAEPSPGELQRWAESLLDPGSPGDFNQALMELGAVVCTPRTPRCGECPVSAFCQARVSGTVLDRPRPRKSRPLPRYLEAVSILLWRGGGGGSKLLFRRRPPKGLLAGMWEFPGVILGREEGAPSRRDARGSSQTPAPRGPTSALEPSRLLETPSAWDPTPLAEVEQIFTHRRIRYLPTLWLRQGTQDHLPPAPAEDPEGRELRWLGPEEARATLPLPVAQGALLHQVGVWLVEGPGRAEAGVDEGEGSGHHTPHAKGEPPPS